MIGYFQSVGNSYANSIWEELLNVEESVERFVFVDTTSTSNRSIVLAKEKLVDEPHLFLK